MRSQSLSELFGKENYLFCIRGIKLRFLGDPSRNLVSMQTSLCGLLGILSIYVFLLTINVYFYAYKCG